MLPHPQKQKIDDTRTIVSYRAVLSNMLFPPGNMTYDARTADEEARIVSVMEILRFFWRCWNTSHFHPCFSRPEPSLNGATVGGNIFNARLEHVSENVWLHRPKLLTQVS